MNKNLYKFLKSLKQNAKSSMMAGVFLMLGGFVFSSLAKVYTQVPVKLITYFAIGIGFLLTAFTWVAQIFVKEKFDVEKAESIINPIKQEEVFKTKENRVKQEITQEKDKTWDYIDKLQENLKGFGERVEDDPFNTKEKPKA